MSASETVTLEASRIDLANDALLEITQLSQTLRDFIAANDKGGQVLYVARGLLARIQTLSEATSECIEARLEERGNDGALKERIECRKEPAHV